MGFITESKDTSHMQTDQCNTLHLLNEREKTIIFIDTEKEFDKSQHRFTIKALIKQEKGNLLY